MIPAGKLNVRITLLEPGAAQEDADTGQVSTAAPTEFPVWSERWDRGGAERREGEAEVGLWTTRFRVRADPRIARVNPRWKLRDDRGYTYHIESVGQVGRSGWDLFCTLRV